MAVQRWKVRAGSCRGCGARVWRVLSPDGCLAQETATWMAAMWVAGDLRALAESDSMDLDTAVKVLMRNRVIRELEDEAAVAQSAAHGIHEIEESLAGEPPC